MRNLIGQVTDSIKEAAKKTSETLSSAVEHEDTQAAIEWAKKTANTAADEAVKLGQEVARSDLAKDAPTGAAVTPRDLAFLHISS